MKLVGPQVTEQDPEEPDPAGQADHDEVEQEVEQAVLLTIAGHDDPSEG